MIYHITSYIIYDVVYVYSQYYINTSYCSTKYISHIVYFRHILIVNKVERKNGMKKCELVVTGGVVKENQRISYVVGGNSGR